ncbi:SAM-dependent methyltransferase [Idiomarina tyrosinivorans]|uniref:tRNA (guanine(46)-N(7))-methyltransferase n=2 Tax=Idiomarina tyrosinivorans TaxID=1445662 RepID=A0A432ZSN1_9GAMM|nr:SAM-dependent methyltransferase [Idiomarina tyrosinivorans]
MKHVERQARSTFKKPIQQHNQAAFDEINARVAESDKPLILDSCCGVGESTAWLAQQYPQALVVGVDKSAHRLARHGAYQGQSQGHNYWLVRADLIDFWRLAAAAGWRLEKHYLLYPNPYPKASQLSRRWHASPVWKSLWQLGGELVMRSNWVTYLTEVAESLTLIECQAQIAPLLRSHQAMTPFERKYQRSQQQLWQLRAQLPEEVRFE